MQQCAMENGINKTSKCLQQSTVTTEGRASDSPLQQAPPSRRLVQGKCIWFFFCRGNVSTDELPIPFSKVLTLMSLSHCSSQASSFWVIGCFLTLLPPPSSSGVAFLNLLVFALVEFYKTTLFDASVYLGELESHWQTVSTSNLPIQTVIDCLLKQGCYLRRCTGWLKH